MRKRMKTIGGATAALVALALGGSAIASATQHAATAGKHPKVTNKSVPREKTTGPDTDKIQSGDQTTPDKHGAKASSVSTSETSTSETTSESENASASDGPGGHEDPAGNVEFHSEAQE
jgi:cytoskeletal protein RodZ